MIFNPDQNKQATAVIVYGRRNHVNHSFLHETPVKTVPFQKKSRANPGRTA